MWRCLKLPVFLPIFGLGLISLIMIWSLVPSSLGRQLASWLIGFLALFLATTIDWRRLFSFRLPIYIFVLAILIFPLVMGQIIRGSSRWINIGNLAVQPSELAKPLLILSLALIISATQTLIKKNFYPLFLAGLGFFPVLLILLQPDLGTAMVMAFSSGVVILSAVMAKKAKLWPILALGFAFLFLLPVVWQYGLQDYQKQRIIYFLNPKQDPLGKGYHLIQAQIALGSGGFLGKGIRRGGQSQLEFLPERHTDFIFAALGEELGYLGVVFLLIFYFWFFALILKLIFNSKSEFGFFLGIGLVSQIWFQALVNMGMNMGTFPITGITLPFVSYGGSSLVSLLFSLGMIFSATCH